MERNVFVGSVNTDGRGVVRCDGIVDGGRIVNRNGIVDGRRIVDGWGGYTGRNRSWGGGATATVKTTSHQAYKRI